jgi:hypothetical protein
VAFETPYLAALAAAAITYVAIGLAESRYRGKPAVQT